MDEGRVVSGGDAGADTCTSPVSNSSNATQLTDSHWDWIHQMCGPAGASTRSGNEPESPGNAPPGAQSSTGSPGAPGASTPPQPAAPGGEGPRVLDHVLGGVKMIGGALETAAGASLTLAGAATSEFGVGIGIMAVGAAVTLHGADVTVSGARTMVSGEQKDTGTSQILQAAGMSRTAANLADAGISVAGTLGAGAATRAPTVAAAVAEGSEGAAAAAPAAADAAAVGENSVSLAFKPGLPTGHNMVGVTADGTTQWSHLVVGGTEGTSGGASHIAAAGTDALVVSSQGPSAAYITATVPVTAEQAQAARAAVQAAEAEGTAGAYSYLGNNCTTYATSIVSKAGVAAPATTPAVALATTALQAPEVAAPIAASGAVVSGVDGVAAVASPGPTSQAPVSKAGDDEQAGVCRDPEAEGRTPASP